MGRQLLSIITLCVIIGTINCYYRHRRYDPYDEEDEYGYGGGGGGGYRGGYGGGYGRRPVRFYAGGKGGLSDTKLKYKEFGKEFDYAHRHDNRRGGSGVVAGDLGAPAVIPPVEEPPAVDPVDGPVDEAATARRPPKNKLRRRYD